MKKLYSRYKWLTIFLAISIVLVVLHYLTYNLPELFSGAGRLFDIAFQLSIGYIINFAFFIVNIYLPQLDSETKAAKACQLPIVSLLEEIRSIENIFSSFIKLNSGRIIYPTGILYYQYPNSSARSFIDITEYLKKEYSIIQRRFSTLISNRYFGSLDTKIIELINDLQYSNFLSYMNHFSYCDGDLNRILFGQNIYVDSLEESYIKFIDTAQELQRLTNAKLSPLKQFSILEGPAREEYINFIEEKRATFSPDMCKYGECHIENNRIY